jgi:hypothetical protein
MNKEYNKEVRLSKAKLFFRSVLKDNQKYLNKPTSIEPLATLLSEQLIQKLEKEADAK